MAQQAVSDKLCCAQSRKSQQWNKKKKKTKLQFPASEMNKLILVCSQHSAICMAYCKLSQGMVSLIQHTNFLKTYFSCAG